MGPKTSFQGRPDVVPGPTWRQGHPRRRFKVHLTSFQSHLGVTGPPWTSIFLRMANVSCRSHETLFQGQLGAVRLAKMPFRGPLDAIEFPKMYSKANLRPPGSPERHSEANLTPSGSPKRHSEATLTPSGCPKRRSKANSPRPKLLQG